MILKTFIVVSIVTITASTVNAQPNPEPGGPGTNGQQGSGPTSDFGNQLPNAPFDGGMSLMLLASGIAYGAKKLRNLGNQYF